MKTREIPKEEWSKFFNTFSRQHKGWLITMEIFGDEIGAQVQDRELTFQGITDDWDEVSGNAITVTTGGKTEAHITHNIDLPTQVSLEQTDDGTDIALAIKSVDGTTALLRFCSPMPPQWVDGIVASVTQVPF